MPRAIEIQPLFSDLFDIHNHSLDLDSNPSSFIPFSPINLPAFPLPSLFTSFFPSLSSGCFRGTQCLGRMALHPLSLHELSLPKDNLFLIILEVASFQAVYSPERGYKLLGSFRPPSFSGLVCCGVKTEPMGRSRKSQKRFKPSKKKQTHFGPTLFTACRSELAISTVFPLLRRVYFIDKNKVLPGM